MKRVHKLRDQARRRFRVADLTADDTVAAALLAYACEPEQGARLIESAGKDGYATRSYVSYRRHRLFRD